MPVTEIGAGTGYWAYLLDQLGVNVLAYDKYLDSKNPYCEPDFWYPVQRGNSNSLMPKDNALMLCWPPYGGYMALNALRNYRGNTVIYIGEDWGGCCATKGFFQYLNKLYKETHFVEIPQWYGMHDNMWIYQR